MAILSQGALTISNIGGGVSGESLDAWSWVGTSPLEEWIAAGYPHGTATTGNPAVDTLLVVPRGFPRIVTLDRIAFECATVGGAGSVARVGIYKATSTDNPYPSALVVDGGEKVTDVGTGVKSSNIAVTLEAFTYYWFAYLCGVANPTIRCNEAVYTKPIGLVSTFGSAPHHVALSVALAYAALPATFPAGATGTYTNPPLIGVRRSA